MAAPIYRGGRPFFKPGLRFGNNVGVFPVSGVPSATYLANVAGPGSVLLSTSGATYVNIGTKAVPVWSAQGGGSGATSVEVLTAARVLTMADNGKTFALASAGGFDVTLPALATSTGFKATFIVQVAPTTSYTITSPEGDNIAGQAYIATTGTSGDIEAAFTADVITFVLNSSVIGDSCSVQALAAGWVAKGFASLAASLTFTG